MFPLWKAGRNYKGYSEGAVPAQALAVALVVALALGTNSQPSCEASQCGSNLPLALLS